MRRAADLGGPLVLDEPIARQCDTAMKLPTRFGFAIAQSLIARPRTRSRIGLGNTLMKRDDLYDFLARCDAHRSLEPLFADYAEILKSYGFSSFIFTGLPTHGDDVESYIIKNAWPDEWTDRYREQRYFLKDPVSQWSLTRSRPFLWEEARGASIVTAHSAKIENEARAFGLGEGVAFPMYDASSWQAVISLATADKCDLEKRFESA